MVGPGRPSRVDVYRRLEIAIDELRTRMGGLPSPTEAEDIWSGIWYEEAHHSTAIEGNTLVLREVEALLAEGRAVGNKQLSEYLEVRGYGAAAQWVYGQAIEPGSWSDGQVVSLTEVRQVHRLALDPVWKIAPHPDASPHETPGSFRQHDIRPFPGGMTPPSWTDVPMLMRDWVDDACRLGGADASFPEAVAALHNRFERIHPFLDGNGRAGRLLLNLILVRGGYAPAIIYKRERDKYLAAMRRADRGESGALAELIVRSVLDNLYRFIVPAVAGPSRLVPLAALASHDASLYALRSAAARGRLRAQKGSDNQWRSSQAWVEQYLESRYQRGQ